MGSEILQTVPDKEKDDFQGDTTRTLTKVAKSFSTILSLPSVSLVLWFFISSVGFTDGSIACQCRRRGFDPWVRKTHWRRKWQPTRLILPGKSHGQRCLGGVQCMGLQKELDVT